MLRIVFVTAAAAALAGAGIVHGLYTGRWGPSPDLRAAAGRLADVPSEVGGWRGEDLPADPAQMEIAEVTGHLFRRYTNAITREEVNVLIVCGLPGPVSLHPPDVCYRGVGYQMASKEVRRVAGGEFWSGEFVKPGPAPVGLRIYWAWSPTGAAWSAPDGDPRARFLGEPWLYKMYVICPRTPAGAEDPARNFLEVMLPELAKVLPPGPEA
ncbi:MAG TPA: exosortase-associated EpsI family protein [Gemmataceae bacterium]